MYWGALQANTDTYLNGEGGRRGLGIFREGLWVDIHLGSGERFEDTKD